MERRFRRSLCLRSLRALESAPLIFPKSSQKVSSTYTETSSSSTPSVPKSTKSSWLLRGSRYMARLPVTGADLGLYTRIRCGFDKHLYLTSCLIACNHNKYVFPQTGCTARKMAHFIINQDRQTQVRAATAKQPPYNNRLKFMISVIIVTGKVFHCFCL